MKTKLNVIMIGPFLYPHGFAATKRKQQFLDYIIEQNGIARVLLTLKWSKGNELNNEKGEFNGVKYELLGKCVKKNILFPFTFLFFIIRSFYKLIIYKKGDKKNIIVAFGVNFDNVIPLLFAKILNYKIVFDIVEDFDSFKKSKPIKNKIKYNTLIGLQKFFIKRLANSISVISTRLMDKYKNQGVKVPIEIIPISASNLNFIPVLIKSSYFSLLYAGTYGEKEGLPTLIESFSRFSKTIKNSKLVLTGNCPNNIKTLLINTLGSFENVIFTGRLNDDDFYNQLANANVLLMTRTNSHFANTGFPYKLGEYLATSNPVIATRVSDVENYLSNNENIFLIKPDDEQELFDKIMFIYSNYENAIQVGLKGKIICEKHFNPAVNSANFYKILLHC